MSGNINKRGPDNPENQICKCDHSRTRHAVYNSGKNVKCLEIGCRCNQFVLHYTK